MTKDIAWLVPAVVLAVALDAAPPPPAAAPQKPQPTPVAIVCPSTISVRITRDVLSAGAWPTPTPDVINRTVPFEKASLDSPSRLRCRYYDEHMSIPYFLLQWKPGFACRLAPASAGPSRQFLCVPQ
ncbi:MAG TPA: hypothetical protein VMT19_04580 [Thermoanaerobaculaceae bacterium]|nr:hypothetical protein [Thermoanaerobaculaceae bacterium]